MKKELTKKLIKKLTKKQEKQFLRSVIKHHGNCDPITENTKLLEQLDTKESIRNFCDNLCPLRNRVTTQSFTSFPGPHKVFRSLYEQKAYHVAIKLYAEKFPEEIDFILEAVLL